VVCGFCGGGFVSCYGAVCVVMVVVLGGVGCGRGFVCGVCVGDDL